MGSKIPKETSYGLDNRSHPPSFLDLDQEWAGPIDIYRSPVLGGRVRLRTRVRTPSTRSPAGSGTRPGVARRSRPGSHSHPGSRPDRQLILGMTRSGGSGRNTIRRSTSIGARLSKCRFKPQAVDDGHFAAASGDDARGMKALANAKVVPYQSLLKAFLADRLAQERGRRAPA